MLIRPTILTVLLLTVLLLTALPLQARRLPLTTPTRCLPGRNHLSSRAFSFAHPHDTLVQIC
jgi:hypothetical protein